MLINETASHTVEGHGAFQNKYNNVAVHLFITSGRGDRLMFEAAAMNTLIMLDYYISAHQTGEIFTCNYKSYNDGMRPLMSCERAAGAGLPPAFV